jgi:hypothetical protein
MLGAGTTLMVLIIHYREVILGSKMLSSIIHAINKCVPLLIIMKRIIPTRQLRIKIRCVALLQHHSVGHCRRYHRR